MIGRFGQPVRAALLLLLLTAAAGCAPQQSASTVANLGSVGDPNPAYRETLVGAGFRPEPGGAEAAAAWLVGRRVLVKPWSGARPETISLREDGSGVVVRDNGEAAPLAWRRERDKFCFGWGFEPKFGGCVTLWRHSDGRTALLDERRGLFTVVSLGAAATDEVGATIESLAGWLDAEGLRDKVDRAYRLTSGGRFGTPAQTGVVRIVLESGRRCSAVSDGWTTPGSPAALTCAGGLEATARVELAGNGIRLKTADAAGRPVLLYLRPRKPGAA